MAFLDQRNNKHRAVTIIAVTALECAAIYAVVSGLAVRFVPRSIPPNPQGEVIKLTPLPPPKPLPTPSTRPADPVIDRDITIIDLPTVRDPAIDDFQPLPSPTPLATQDPIVPRPSPIPQFTPKAPAPTTSPAGWVTANDYPARDLREGNQGRVSFALTVGSDGKVQSCTVTRSSGFPGLDAATCAAVSRRARFKPATDDSGAQVAGSYANSIRWVIPE